MECANGHSNEDTQRFCGECGVLLPEFPPVALGSPNAVGPRAEMSTEAVSKSKRLRQVAAGIVAVTVLVGGITVAITRRDPSPRKPVVRATTTTQTRPLRPFESVGCSSSKVAEMGHGPTAVVAPSWMRMTNVRIATADDTLRIAANFESSPVAGLTGAETGTSASWTVQISNRDSKTEWTTFNSSVGNPTVSMFSGTAASAAPGYRGELTGGRSVWGNQDAEMSIPWRDIQKSSPWSDLRLSVFIDGFAPPDIPIGGTSCPDSLEIGLPIAQLNPEITGSSSTTPETFAPPPSGADASACTAKAIRVGEAYQVANTALSPDFDPSAVISDVRCDNGWAAVFFDSPPTAFAFFQLVDGRWSGGLHAEGSVPPTATDLIILACHDIPPIEIAILLKVPKPSPCGAAGSVTGAGSAPTSTSTVPSTTRTTRAATTTTSTVAPMFAYEDVLIAVTEAGGKIIARVGVDFNSSWNVDCHIPGDVPAGKILHCDVSTMEMGVTTDRGSASIRITGPVGGRPIVIVL